MNEDIEMIELLFDCTDLLEAYKNVPISKREEFKKLIVKVAELLTKQQEEKRYT